MKTRIPSSNSRIRSVHASVLLAWGLIHLAGGNALEAASLELVAPSSYSIWGEDNNQVFSIQVLNPDGLDEDYFVTFSVPAGGVHSRQLQSGTRTISYQLTRSPTGTVPLKDFPDIRQGEVLVGSAKEGVPRQVLNFYVRLEESEWPMPGDYSDSVVLRLFRGTVSAAEEIASQTIVIMRSVSERMDLALNIGGDSGALDFGLLTKESTRTVACRVTSNTEYQLSFHSEFGGHMQSELGERLAYRFEVSGQEIDLSAGRESLALPPQLPAGQGGRLHDLSVTLLPTAETSAGHYRDTVRISIWAP